MTEWQDIEYLKTGTVTQQKVYEVIKASNVMNVLTGFNRMLAGTYPLGINIPGSDLDIICSYREGIKFMKIIRDEFHDHEDFSIVKKEIRGQESVIARFIYRKYKFEIFGQAIPVKTQYAYRHMIIEDKLLRERDNAFREKILDLKIKGLSTEEAFAILLGIKGDPYEGLLKLG